MEARVEAPLSHRDHQSLSLLPLPRTTLAGPLALFQDLDSKVWTVHLQARAHRHPGQAKQGQVRRFQRRERSKGLPMGKVVDPVSVEVMEDDKPTLPVFRVGVSLQ